MPRELLRYPGLKLKGRTWRRQGVGRMSSIEPRPDETQGPPAEHSGEEETGEQVSERSGTGRLSSFVPSSLGSSLGRMAGTAALASQEAARNTMDHARQCSHKRQWKHRAGKAPPGHEDPSASLDWSGVGDRFSSLSWYEHQLVRNVAGDAEASDPKTGGVGTSKHGRGGDLGDLSTIATLEEVDQLVTSPIYGDESNAVDGLSSLDIRGGDLPDDGADAQDEPSPTEANGSAPESFKDPEDALGMQDRPADEVEARDTADKQPSASTKGSSPVSVNLKPVARKSAGLISCLMKKGKNFTVAVCDEAAGSNDPNGAGGPGSEDAEASTAPVDTASPDPLDAEHLEQLKQEASEGNGWAQSQLRRLFGPPNPAMKESCQACGERFGMSRYRHHCKRCGGSFCLQHAKQAHPMPRMGLPSPQRVCSPCKHILELEDWREVIEWRLERIDSYLEGRLIDYFDSFVDTKTDKAWRVMDGAIYVGKVAPLGSTVQVSLQVVDAFRKYGIVGVSALVLRKEFAEAVEMLRFICGNDKDAAMTVHETSAAMFYMMAERREERGNNPNGEHEAHHGCPVLSDEELSSLRRLAPVGMMYPYVPTLELQILCNNTGWSLIFQREFSEVHRPSFALMTSRTTSTAVLAIRGTNSMEDVITDAKTQQVPFPSERRNAFRGENGGARSEGAAEDAGVSSASSGMARSAEWLYREVLHSLVKLRRAGHRILIMGHSLGAGVATLLGPLVREAIPDVRVIAFATPAVANLELSKRCEDICTNVILHDDIVPRVTPRAVRTMLKEAKGTKDFWKKHFQDDMDAVVDRAKDLWAPRSRRMPGNKEKGAPVGGDVEDTGVGRAEDNPGGSLDTEKDPGSVHQPSGIPASSATKAHPPLPARAAGTGAADTGSEAETGGEGGCATEPGVGGLGQGGGGGGGEPPPDSFVPGKIVHIYSQRGVYRACYIPRDHDCLQTFPVYGNIISDHTGAAYFGALAEVAAVRKAEARGAALPEWVPFSSCNECQLCKAEFFWASTLRSEAQRARDKHHCRGCGKLVCHACSDHREALPQFGVVDPSRVCDRCFYGTGDDL